MNAQERKAMQQLEDHAAAWWAAEAENARYNPLNLKPDELRKDIRDCQNIAAAHARTAAALKR